MIAPRAEAEQIVLNRFRLGGWMLNLFVSAISTRWIGEALWPGWNSMAGTIAVALVAAIPFVLIETFALHIAGRLLGNKGRWDVLVALSGYAAVPFFTLVLILGGAAAIYTRAFGSNRIHLAFILLALLALLVVVITGLVIGRHGLGANYGLSGRQAWLLTILGALVFSFGETALRRPFVEKKPIPVADLEAMPQMPAPPLITTGGAARHLAFEYAVNLQYYRRLPVRRGDIVIFRSRDGHSHLGRILGLPGERAGLQNGRLIINGAPWIEPWKTEGDLSIQSRLIGSDEYFIYPDKRRTDTESHARFPEIAERNQILGPVLQMDIALLRLAFDHAQ
jgi:hypothetical protein